MKTILLAGALMVAATSAMAGTSVSISVGQPGFYGRINIGDVPAPQVVYPEPMIIEPQVRYVGEPIYLRVPPAHMKNWKRYCHNYSACGQRVYFVHENWYGNVYAPHYREQMRREQEAHVVVHERIVEREHGRDYHEEHERHDEHGHGHDDHGHDDHGHDDHGHDRDHDHH